MTPNTVFLELSQRLCASRKTQKVLFSDKQLGQWPHEIVATLKTQKLITRINPTKDVICPGCRRRCPMGIEEMPNGDSVVVCDKDDANIGLVDIEEGDRIRWQSTLHAFIQFIASKLDLPSVSIKSIAADQFQIGMATGKKRSQMLLLCLEQDMMLVAGSNKIILIQVIQFSPNGYFLDKESVQRLVDASTTGDPRHTPNRHKQELRKEETAETHQSWQDEYQRLKKEHPDQTKGWYARKISKLPIAQGRTIGTILRNLKS